MGNAILYTKPKAKFKHPISEAVILFETPTGAYKSEIAFSSSFLSFCHHGQSNQHQH
jgi:hypothetical protein